MRLYLLLCFIVVLSAVGAAGRTISGVVVSERDSTAVVGAAVRLMQPDGTLVEGALSESDGRFKLETRRDGRLKLDVVLTGYSGSEVLISEGHKNIDLGPIFLADAIGLDEVTVNATTRFQSKGRTIVLPSAADVKASGSTLGLFQKLVLPGLDANPINRSLSVDGGMPKILINGVPSTMTDVNALQPKDIERIEYSRITPARWADSGAKGMINIVLKKRNDGGQIYLWGRSALATAFVDGTVNLSYHQGPSQFTVNYTPSWRNCVKVSDRILSSYIADDFEVQTDNSAHSYFNYFLNNASLKYNYKPSERTLMSVAINTTTVTGKTRSRGEATDSWSGDYDYNSFSKNRDVAPSLDLFLRHDFNDRNSLETQVVGTISSSDYMRENRYDYISGTKNSYLTDINSKRRSLISAISYIHSFSDIMSLSAGYQNTISHNANTYRESNYKPTLTDNNNYIYGRLTRQQGNVYLSVSTGAKIYHTDNADNRRTFVRNLSSAVFSWSFKNAWNLQGAFQYNPSIPSLSSLTDHPQQLSPYLVANGNPDLKIAENFTYQLMLSYQKNKFSATLSGTYCDRHNSIINDVVYLGNRTFLSQAVNIDKNNTLQGELSVGVSDLAGFGANVSVEVTHTQVEGQGWSHDLTAAGVNFSLWWNKGPYTVGYWHKIPAKALYGHEINKDENGSTLTFQYKPDNHWTLAGLWMFPFEKYGVRYLSKNISAISPETNLRHIRDDRNMVVIHVSYSTDFGSIFKTGRRSLNNADSNSSILKL